jgi:hypothetical protein
VGQSGASQGVVFCQPPQEILSAEMKALKTLEWGSVGLNWFWHAAFQSTWPTTSVAADAGEAAPRASPPPSLSPRPQVPLSSSA